MSNNPPSVKIVPVARKGVMGHAGALLMKIPPVRAGVHVARVFAEGHPRVMRAARAVGRAYNVFAKVYTAVMLASTVVLGGLYLWGEGRRQGEMKDDYAARDKCDTLLDQGIACSFEEQWKSRRVMANETARCTGWSHPCAPEFPRIIEHATKPLPAQEPSAPRRAFPAPPQKRAQEIQAKTISPAL